MSLQLLQLEGSLYTNSSTTKRSSSSRTSPPFINAENDKQESKSWGDQQMQNVRTMQEPTKIKGKNYQQELDLGDIDLWIWLGACTVGAQIRTWPSIFVDNRSIVTKADEARFAVKWLAFRAMLLASQGNKSDWGTAHVVFTMSI